MSSFNRKDKWRNMERYCCSICNVWMGGDKQSIRIHENGKKHRENLEEQLKQRRLDKTNKEKAAQKLNSTMKIVEQVAAEAYAKDVKSGGAFCCASTENKISKEPRIPFAGALPTLGSTKSISFEKKSLAKRSDLIGLSKEVLPSQVNTSRKGKNCLSSAAKEIDSWHLKKKNRVEKKRKAVGLDENNCIENDIKEIGHEDKKVLAENEGHYSVGSMIFLEGSAYAPILEVDMPAQIWTGASLSEQVEREMRSEHNTKLWKAGVIVKIIKDDSHGSNDHNRKVIRHFDFAFLMNPDDDEETYERLVDSKRIRLVVGSGDGVPQSVQEARLLLMGGEEIVEHFHNKHNDNDSTLEIDENTGFTKFTTVSVKKISVTHEANEEKARAEARRKENLQNDEQRMRDLEKRRMEESKHANADDSALGAYDIWGSTAKVGYKGINISSNFEESDSTTNISKSNVGPILFKKRSFFKKAKKGNTRKTSSDDYN